MDLSRLRGGELIAGVGGIVLLVALLFLNWYSGVSVETGFGEFEVGGELGAWDRQGFLGTLANLVILAAGIVGVGSALLTATSSTVALPVAASALTAAGGFAAVVMVLLRMLFQPGEGEAVDLEVGIFVALIGAVGVAYGGWQSMQEEGTTFGEARDQLQDRLGEGEPAPPGAGDRAEPAPPVAPGDQETAAPPPAAEPPPPAAEPPPPAAKPPSTRDEPLPPVDEAAPARDEAPPPVDEPPPPAAEPPPPPEEQPPTGDEATSTDDQAPPARDEQPPAEDEQPPKPGSPEQPPTI